MVDLANMKGQLGKIAKSEESTWQNNRAIGIP
jgi:hypothetical protein